MEIGSRSGKNEEVESMAQFQCLVDLGVSVFDVTLFDRSAFNYEKYSCKSYELPIQEKKYFASLFPFELTTATNNDNKFFRRYVILRIYLDGLVFLAA